MEKPLVVGIIVNYHGYELTRDCLRSFAGIDLATVFLSSQQVVILKNRGPLFKEDDMRKKTFSEEQIALALRESETGTPVTEVCRSMGMSEQSFYRCRKKCMGMGFAGLRRLRQLEEENRKLKRPWYRSTQATMGQKHVNEERRCALPPSFR
jgi:putative transposase